jgi:hypothetical protein
MISKSQYILWTIADRSWIPDFRKLAQDKNFGFLQCLDSGFHCMNSGLQS